MKNKKMRILGASIGNCVHVAGVSHFLALAGHEGWDALFLGPAVPVDAYLRAVEDYKPDVAAVGYRLTPENALTLAKSLAEGAAKLSARPRWVFGGTRPVAEAVRSLGFFDTIYDGSEDLDDCIAFFRGGGGDRARAEDGDTLFKRIALKKPYPLLRHHFGLPSFEDTLSGVARIAQSRALDVISLGIDQNTQQFFFHPEKRDPAFEGAGGVPVRDEAGFAALKEASKTGNHPLMRCYSGTADVVPFGEMLLKTIDNAWCATPLNWFNRLDGRGERTIAQTVSDARALCRLHAARGVPVEINEPHHWALRDAHDTVSVAAAYISARAAKAWGVRDYVAQYMFNVPGALDFSMDLAKALAQIDLVESLADEAFTTHRETRAGLPFLSADLDVAKGQLAASTCLQMAVRPEIIHVVGYSEAEHAATPEVVIESCRIVRGAVRSVLEGAPDPSLDPRVAARRAELVGEAKWLLDFIRDYYANRAPDPLTDPSCLEDAVKRGLLDAPHILKGGEYRGVLKTRIEGGRVVAWDGKPLTERERIDALRREGLL